MMTKLIFSSLLLSMSVGGMAQNATFKFFSYEGKDQRFNQQINADRQYLNPILAGFYPDPSVCRKGDTYYLVNSTFSFYPGVPLFMSKDLVNWQQLGHVLNSSEQLQLGTQPVSGGIFAPAISYNEKNKTFYMVTTNVGKGNFYVKSKDPQQGWSQPIPLPQVDGIDPSFFFDKNGKAYLVHNGKPATAQRYEGECSIWLHEFDVKGDSLVGAPCELVRGGTHVDAQPIWIEGPHLFRHGKYYYLMCAEGGTECRHSEVIFRAKHPFGPWEEYAGNPILTQRDLTDNNRTDMVTSTGHAEFIQTPEGEWWAVFLGCRPYEDDYYNTGRETFLLPVTWNDGWPTILPKQTAVPTVVEKKQLAVGEGSSELTGNFSFIDCFDGKKLDGRWCFLRNPSPFYSFGDEPGLTICPLANTIYDSQSPSAIFVRQKHSDFTAETWLDFEPKDERALAGMALFQNEEYNIVLGKTLIKNRPAVRLLRTEKTTVTIASAPLHGEGPLRLKVVGRGRYADFYFAEGRGEWQLLAQGVDVVNLSTRRAGGFVGNFIALYATHPQ